MRNKSGKNPSFCKPSDFNTLKTLFQKILARQGGQKIEISHYPENFSHNPLDNGLNL